MEDGEAGTTDTTASALLMLSPRLRPLLNGMATEAGDTTEDGEAGTDTTASAPLRESPRPIPRLTPPSSTTPTPTLPTSTRPTTAMPDTRTSTTVNASPRPRP